MKRPLILNLLLAAALIVPAAALAQTPSSENATIETIMDRRSVRSYTDEPVCAKQVELLLRAAMAAPSAVNKQPWAFVVVNKRELLDSLAAALPYAKMLSQASVAIVVCGDTAKSLLGSDQAYWVQDCSAATENLLLAAHSMRLGAVWTGVFPRAERVATVRRILNIPAHLTPLNVIPIGHPKGDSKPKDKWDPANIYYNKF